MRDAAGIQHLYDEREGQVRSGAEALWGWPSQGVRRRLRKFFEIEDDSALEHGATQNCDHDALIGVGGHVLQGSAAKSRTQMTMSGPSERRDKQTTIVASCIQQSVTPRDLRSANHRRVIARIDLVQNYWALGDKMPTKLFKDQFIGKKSAACLGSGGRLER